MTRSRANPPTRSRDEEALLLDAREVLPGRRWTRWAAPSLARGVRAGQYLHVLRPRPAGLLLPVVPVAGYDRVAGEVSLLLADEGAAAMAARLAVGQTMAVVGPLGRGFAIDARSRYLLLVADTDGFSRVRALVDEAVTEGRQITVLLGAQSVADVYPSSLLPEQVEYVVATRDGSLGHRGHILDLVPAYEAWADQCFGAGSDDLLGGLARLARGRDGRMGVARLGRRPGRRTTVRGGDARRRAWLQLALRHDAGCALGICSGCVVNGIDGPLRACREGPTVAADELRPEGIR